MLSALSPVKFSLDVFVSVEDAVYVVFSTLLKRFRENHRSSTLDLPLICLLPYIGLV